MKKVINKFLMKHFGEEHWFHWQNLNDLPGIKDRQGHPFWHGRAWLHMGVRKALGISWNFKSSFCGADVTFEAWGDRDVSFHVAFPPVSLWLTIEGIVPKHMLEKVDNRSIGWSIHHWMLWVYPWKHINEWNSTDPKWWDMSINLHPGEWLLGGTEYKQDVLAEKVVDVPMPEKCYKMKVTLSEDSWPYKRAPWLGKKVSRAHCEMEEPIPHPGKGTTSYNCGDDGLQGMTMPCSSFEEAIGKVVESVLYKRRRYPL
jgi:hypothetical protein